MSIQTGLFCAYRAIASRNLEVLEATWRSYSDMLVKAGGIGNYSVEMFQTYAQVLESGLHTIVYAAMAAEGFIFYYGAKRLSKSYVKEYLDKLDIYAKWLVVPRLLNGKSLSTDHRGMQLLRALIKNRNNLVHYKTSLVTPNEGDPVTIHFLANARDAVSALNLIADELDTLDSTADASRLIGSKADSIVAHRQIP